MLFVGVLYHLRHPLLALDLIHEHVTRDLFVYQSLQRGGDAICSVESDYDFWQAEMFDDPAWPRLHFIEHSYAHDPTNWGAPNRACSEAMLRSAGFEVIGHPESEIFVCRHMDRADDSDYGAVYPARPTRAP